MTADLTKKQSEILAVLEQYGLTAQQIAQKAGVATRWPAETAANYANALVRKGYASKDGTGKFPLWKRARR